MADLLSVIVGGFIAVGGGAGMQWYLHHNKTKEERRSKRAAKFEELVTTIYEHDHWLTYMRNVRVFGAEDKHILSPMAKMKAISAVYFPEFNDRLRELDLAADRFEQWMFEAGKVRLKEGAAAIEGHLEARREYAERRHKLLGDLAHFAKETLQQV